jgi:murein DD-endopeptidase MepM/ murein hydrolase activator NlpD
MPRTAKKIGVAVALGFFRALMVLKRVAVFLFSLLKTPFMGLYRWIILPLLGLGYKFFRQLRRQVEAAVDHLRDGMLRILANRFAIYVVIVVLSCSVAVTNIAAQGTGTDNEGPSTQSLVDTIQGDVQAQEEFVQESADNAPPVNADVSYMGATALSQRDIVNDQSYDGSDSGLSLEDDESVTNESPLANAVRVLPTYDENQPSTRTRVEEHVVQPGETIGTIAQTYGLRVSTIIAANQIRGGVIHPGDTLRILPVDGIVYTVKKGDTINSVADRFSSSADEIISANGLASGVLASGMELVLPGGKAPEPPKPKPQPAPRISTSVATSLKNLIIPPPAADRQGGAKMLWPAGVHRITQYFRGRLHTGVDIAGPIGTPIYAADDGVVLKAEWNTGGYGNMTIVDHGGGVFTRYGHAVKLLTKPGQTVKRGDVIALMGSTGHSTGPHLHFEVMTGTVAHRVNPLEWTK